MPARKPRPADEKPQFERFLEAAREFGADETDEKLDGVFRKVMKSPTVEPSVPPSRRSGKQPAS